MCVAVFLPPTIASAVIMLSVTSVCLSVMFMLISESIDLQSSFLVHGYIFRLSGSSSCIQVIGSRWRSQQQNEIYDRNY